jgi:hypothetical protein
MVNQSGAIANIVRHREEARQHVLTSADDNPRRGCTVVVCKVEVSQPQTKNNNTVTGKKKQINRTSGSSEYYKWEP